MVYYFIPMYNTRLYCKNNMLVNLFYFEFKTIFYRTSMKQKVFNVLYKSNLYCLCDITQQCKHQTVKLLKVTKQIDINILRW